MKRTKCFLLDDDPIFCNGILQQATHFGIDLDIFYSPLEFERLDFFDYAAGIVDFDLGAVQGPELKNYLAAIFRSCPIVYISGKERIDLADGVSPVRHFVSKTQGFRKILHATVKMIENEQPSATKRFEIPVSTLQGVTFRKRGLILIDDDPSYRDLMKAYANSLGVPLDCFSSLADLGSFARIGEYDVAIVDYFLHGMKGNEIAEYFSVFFNDSPVVMVSADEGLAFQKGSWPQSVKDFLPKSVGPRAILLKAVSIYRDTYRNRIDSEGDWRSRPPQELRNPS